MQVVLPGGDESIRQWWEALVPVHFVPAPVIGDLIFTAALSLSSCRRWWKDIKRHSNRKRRETVARTSR